MMNLMSGHRAVLLEGEELQQHQKFWQGYKTGLVRLHPGRWLYPSSYLRFADKIYSFKFRPSDVVVLTYPKCGTTWMHEIISLMRDDNDIAHQDGNLGRHPIRPFLDVDMLLHDHLSDLMSSYFTKVFESLCSGKDMSEGMMLQVTEAAPDPRTIKTHLPLSLLPPSLLETCKVVCVIRNPKDMLVSYFKHCQWTKLMDFRGSLEEFFQYFMNDNVTYGSYGLFLKEIWEKRHHPNLHIMHFEDMKGDISEEMKKLNSFLNTQLSEEKLANIAKRTSFSEMKTRMGTTGVTAEQNEDMKGFFRKGEVNDWKNHFSTEMIPQMEKWLQENVTRIGAGFKFA